MSAPHRSASVTMTAALLRPLAAALVAAASLAAPMHTPLAQAPVRADTVHVAPPTGRSETDRANVQAAFDAVRPGGTVRFAAGRYVLGAGARLTVPDVTVLGHPGGTVLRGCDAGAFAVKERSGIDAVAFGCAGFYVQAERQTIRGLTFEHAWHGIVVGPYPTTAEEAATLGGNPPAAYSAGGQRIEGNVFRRSPNGLRVLGTGTRPSVVRDNDFIDVFHAIGIYGAPLRFLDNRVTVEDPEFVPFTGHPGSAVLVSPGHTDCSGHVIAGNRIEGYPDAIYVLALRGERCRGVEIRDNTIRVARVRLAHGGLFYAPTERDSTMVGAPITLMNNARMTGMPESDTTGVLENVLVRGNRIVGAEGVGIVVQEASSSRIVDNTISGIQRRSPFPGITWDGWAQRWEVANGSGVWLSSGSTGNEIAGNTFEDVAGPAVVVEGDRNRVVVRDPADTVRDLGRDNRVERSGAWPVTSPLADPGPVWAGLGDTAAFSARMEHHVAAADEALDAVRAVEGARTVDNTVMPYEKADRELEQARWLAGLALLAHPDAAFRAHAQAWAGRIDERAATVDGDAALHAALASVDLADARPGLRYVVQRRLAAQRRNGIDRGTEARERVADLRARISALGEQLGNNIFGNRDTLVVHRDSLAGMPPDWLAAHPADGAGMVTVELNPASARPLATFAERESIRRAAFHAQFMAGYPANLPVVDSMRALRHELATLLGYPSWAAYAAEPMMAGSAERIRRFLDEVDEASTDAARRELDELLARRRAEQPAARGIDMASLLYWQNKVRRETYAFDEQAMREYLPYDRVRDGVLASFARMFGLEFRPAPGTPAWSPAVEPYEVWEDGALVGRFYLDMHPREGKFTYAGVFDLRLGGGTLPEAALLANFPGGGAGDPGLLETGALATFFHEFGHLVHSLLQGRATVVGEVEGDFVEAPSQLLEAWAYDPAVLRSFARHHETAEPIPDSLVTAHRRASGFGRALFARTDLYPAVLSFELHETPPAERPTAEIEARVAARYMPLELPEPPTLSASLAHLNPYSSNYYTYLWSAVIARDLLAGFDRDDLLDPAAGRRYRDAILAPAGTAPSAALVERFLGRPFDADAWRAWLGGEAPATTGGRDDVRDGGKP